MEWKWWFRYRLLMPHLLWNDIWWGFLHRTFYRFNKIELKHLKPGYYDVDHRMLHANFTLLESFVEKEKPFEHIDWDHDEKHQYAGSEIKSLYSWWKESYLCRESVMETFPDNLRPGLDDWIDNHGSEGETKWPEYHLALRELWEQEERWNKEETDNLIRLIKIRPYLWT